MGALLPCLSAAFLLHDVSAYWLRRSGQASQPDSLERLPMRGKICIICAELGAIVSHCASCVTTLTLFFLLHNSGSRSRQYSALSHHHPCFSATDSQPEKEGETGRGTSTEGAAWREKGWRGGRSGERGCVCKQSSGMSDGAPSCMYLRRWTRAKWIQPTSRKKSCRSAKTWKPSSHLSKSCCSHLCE